jgi:hypothetical protein
VARCEGLEAILQAPFELEYAEPEILEERRRRLHCLVDQVIADNSALRRRARLRTPCASAWGRRRRTWLPSPSGVCPRRRLVVNAQQAGAERSIDPAIAPARLQRSATGAITYSFLRDFWPGVV